MKLISSKTILPKKFMRDLKMAIRFGPVTKNTPSVTEIQAAVTEINRAAKPEDRVAWMHPACVAVLRDVVAEKPRRGRPRTGVAASDAERARKYRARRRGAVAAS